MEIELLRTNIATVLAILHCCRTILADAGIEALVLDTQYLEKRERHSAPDYDHG